MNHVLLEVLPFALAGAVSPTVLAISTLILASPDRGKLKGFLYFLGTLAFSVVFCVVLYTFFRGVDVHKKTVGQIRIEALIDLIVGVLLVVWAIVRVLQGNPAPKRDQSDRARKPMGPGAAFLAGVVMMAINFSTLPFFALALRAVERSRIPGLEQALLMVLVTTIILIPAWLPVAIAVVAPAASERVLTGLRDALNRHGRAIITAILMLFGIVLILKGGPKLWP